MPRRILMWLIGGLLLVAWAATAATPGSAAPDTGMVLDLTVTITPPTPTSPPPPNTPSATPAPGTPSATSAPGTPSATPKKDKDHNPTDTPTPTNTPPPTGDPRIDKSADPSSGFPGDKITFSIVVRNDSPIPATNVEVEDSVPGEFEIQGASTSQGTVDVSGQRIHAVIGTLPPGGSATIRVSTVIRADAAPGQVDNVAILSTDTPGDNPGNNTSTTTVIIQGPGTPTPGRLTPIRLPPTGDATNNWFIPLAIMALAALLAGLALHARRRIG
jgi:uncharacterized repeat protein (TIGR01451 family)/LPXTG-motif cell wall-anchored protein